MTKHRLIANLLVHNGNIVQTRKFKRTNMVGSAFTAVDFFNGWSVDEIIILDISYNDRQGCADWFINIVQELSRRCFVPLSVGGKIESLEDVQKYMRAGADKIVVNTGAVRRPGLIREISQGYGSQCCIVSIDAVADDALPSGYRVVIDNGREVTDRDVLDWARLIAARGGGEILINNVENDGDKRGYDLNLVSLISQNFDLPVIAMGGVGSWDHLVDGIRLGKADAVAAGNIFHYTEHSTKKAKEFIQAAGLNVRKSAFYKLATPRLPVHQPY